MTHAERVLRLLSDGKPHSHHEGYALGVILHSRVSDLRKRGHVIAAWREGDDYLYQLTSPLSEGERPTTAGSGATASSPSLSGVVVGDSADTLLPGVVSCVHPAQLTLEVAA